MAGLYGVWERRVGDRGGGLSEGTWSFLHIEVYHQRELMTLAFLSPTATIEFVPENLVFFHILVIMINLQLY